MNIITYFNQFLKDNFNNFLKKYFEESNYFTKASDFNHYYNFINDLDSFSDSFMKDIIKTYFEYIDEIFFNSSYRKNYCTSKGFYERKNYVNLFGEITFKRRYYYDKITNERFFFTDFFLGLPKRKHFDPFVCSEIVDASASTSYSKAGYLVSNKIGKRTSNNIYISRATARNIVMNFNYNINDTSQIKKIERIFIMLDEKYVGSQFNQGQDHMIKAAVIFENSKLVYKSKRKINSIDRYQLIGSHTEASINNDLVLKVVNYIYSHYDTDYLKEICFMGDCAPWIKSFPKSCWFKFNKDIKNSFSMDGFHFSQALKLLVTNKNPHWYNALLFAVKKNNISLFKSLCSKFIEDNKDREITITSKMQYILNNWKERQLYQNTPYLKCSMESHISHIFADLFTSRPKAYSKKGLNKLLEIRLLKVNGTDLKLLYLNNVNFYPSNEIHNNNTIIKTINNKKDFVDLFHKNSLKRKFYRYNYI